MSFSKPLISSKQWLIKFLLCETCVLDEGKRQLIYNFDSVNPLLILGCDKKDEIGAKSTVLTVISIEMCNALVSFGQTLWMK